VISAHILLVLFMASFLAAAIPVLTAPSSNRTARLIVSYDSLTLHARDVKAVNRRVVYRAGAAATANSSWDARLAMNTSRSLYAL